MNVGLIPVRQTRGNGCLVPVARLPLELLTRVFKSYLSGRFKFAHEVSRTASGSCRLQDSVFCIAAVCRYWREAALAAPELWSKFSTSGPPAFVATMLARSKESPLTLLMSFYKDRIDDDDLEICRKFNHLFPRTRHLHLVKCKSDLLEELVPENAPLLKSLILEVDPRFVAIGNIKKLESCHMPMLEELFVQIHSVRWTSPILRLNTLTSLDLIACEGARIGSFLDVLESLEAMPLLQRLHLHDMLPVKEHEDECAGRTASLPYLRAIWIIDVASSCIKLFQHIAFPPAAAITLEVTQSWVPSDLSDLLAAAANSSLNHCAAASVPPLLSCAISYELAHGGWANQAAIECYRVGCPLRVEKDLDPQLVRPGDSHLRLGYLTLRINYIGGEIASPVETILRTLPLSELQSLALAGPDPTLWRQLQPTVEALMECFQSMADLRRFAVKGWGVLTLPEALSLPARLVPWETTSMSNKPPFPRPKLFPLLEELTVILLRVNDLNADQLFVRYTDAWTLRSALGVPLKEHMTVYRFDLTAFEAVDVSSVVGASKVRYEWILENDTTTESDRDLRE